MDDPQSFLELIALARSGDSHAAEKLVRLYEPEIRRVIRHRLNDFRLRRQLETADICQSVLGNFFVRLAMGQYDLANSTDLVALLAVMARNKLSKIREKQQAAKRDIRRTDPKGFDVVEIADSATNVSSAVAREELVQLARQKMSDEERRIAERRLNGASWGEIADELGLKADAVRIRYSRALDRIASELNL